MKLLVLFGLVAAVAAEPILTNYHERVGIPQATRIRRAESAQDFDGSRILGGQASGLGQRPYLAGLIVDLLDGRQSVCAGALLSYTRVLSAAHCWRTDTLQGRQVTAVLGSTNLFSGGTRRTTSDVELHAAYNPRIYRNDIAIIRIPHTPYTNVVLRILLPTTSESLVGRWAIGSGFGLTGAGPNDKIETKRHVNLQVISNEACTSLYGPDVVTSTTLCTATTGGTSPCSGDTGGPLALGDGPVDRQLIGVLSFLPAAGCNRALPVGYTRVSSYLSWINARL